jgi:Flp pilus assembly protein TadG
MKHINMGNKKGQSLAETALVLPILLLILTGIIDFGFMFNNYLIVSNSCREGARSAVVGHTNDEITSVVKTFAGTLDSTKLAITINPDLKTGRIKGVAVTVTVKYQYTLITPIIAAIAPGPINLAASTTMRCE